jgi:hypothetical protein
MQDAQQAALDHLIETLDAMVDAGATELPVSAREARLLAAHMQSQQQFVLRDKRGRRLYRDVPVVVVGSRRPRGPVLVSE